MQFKRIAGFTSAHAGAFWSSLERDKWTRATEAPLIPTQVERFGPGSQWVRGMQFQITNDPSCRTQVRDDSNEWMVQIQNNRFHVNWMGAKGDYPRFGVLRDLFAQHLDRFKAFLTECELQSIAPNQWEVTYVNEIPRGTVWQDASDWSFFKLLSDATFRSTLESFSGEWHFMIPEQKGRIHIQWKHAVKEEQSDEPDFIRLSFTARGPITETDGGVLAGIDLGRTEIVTLFRETMTAEANRYWGLKE